MVGIDQYPNVEATRSSKGYGDSWDCYHGCSYFDTKFQGVIWHQ